ncbi:hypothetical protein [Erythrobacter litoralis]|nr:hypothetical protein [Erythrobacter litoralis]
MTLFTSDLARNFGVGFAAGTLLVAFTSGKVVFDAVPQFLATLF